MYILDAIVGLARDDGAATLVEYGLLLALIALAAITAMSTLGGQVSSLFTNAGNDL
jgi:pilus assembly protein Flp/PilA